MKYFKLSLKVEEKAKSDTRRRVYEIAFAIRIDAGTIIIMTHLCSKILKTLKNIENVRVLYAKKINGSSEKKSIWMRCKLHS